MDQGKGNLLVESVKVSGEFSGVGSGLKDATRKGVLARQSHPEGGSWTGDSPSGRVLTRVIHHQGWSYAGFISSDGLVKGDSP